jgi:hypothetical protein
MGNAFRNSSVIGVTMIVSSYLLKGSILRKRPFNSAEKTETNIPARTNRMGKRALFSIKLAMSRIGIKIEINKI